MSGLVLALDQGTTSSRAILFDPSGRALAASQREISQHFPRPGDVRHDPDEIWSTQLETAREVLAAAGVGPAAVTAIGVTNQRETTVVWDRATGRAIAPAVVWQSRITAPRCQRLRAAGHEPLFRERTGLPLDAYFSGPKIVEVLDSIPGARARAEAGELAFGTVDSFLLWRLTGGRVHATDVSNASRTLLFDLHRLAWDEELCGLIGVPSAMLPTVVPSSGLVGETEPALFGRPIPIAGLAGDQQAATFGQACHTPGDAKTTYGTGAFLLANTGDKAVRSVNGLLTTVLWQLTEGGPATYALEGSVFVAGAAVQWLRDGLKAIAHSGEVEALAATARLNDELVVVPAFAGLGAPHWDPDARGLIIGVDRGTSLAEIARATVDAIAYQVTDVLEAMVADLAGPLGAIRVDGGAAVNNDLLQLQADLLGVPVERPVVTETTALGAAFLAGLATGVWSGLEELGELWRLDRRFEPRMGQAERDRRLARWRRAVERAKGWAREA